jgi:YegS/Rv2252/BmrU family lipid kinase
MLIFQPNWNQMTEQLTKWLVLVNPNAGARKGEKEWPAISRTLTNEGFSFEVQFTKASLDAIRLIEQGIRSGYRKIIVIGGDGTFNEVANGILNQSMVPSTDISLGLIPVGTGNDWGRMYQIPSNVDEAIRVIKRGKTFIQDVCRVSYQEDGIRKSRYSINLAGIGFDAEVVRRTNLGKKHGKSGHLLYFWYLLTALLSYKSLPLRIRLDNEDREDEYFAISIGICKYKGGGMITVPRAIPDDGFLDLTLIRKIGKIEVIRSLPLLFNGHIDTHKRVDTLRSRKVRVDSEKIVYLEVDGESLGHTPLEFETIPLALKLISGT